MNTLIKPLLMNRSEHIRALCELIEVRSALTVVEGCSVRTELKSDIAQVCDLVQCLELCVNRREWSSLKAVIRDALADIDPPPNLPL